MNRTFHRLHPGVKGLAALVYFVAKKKIGVVAFICLLILVVLGIAGFAGLLGVGFKLG